MKYLLDTNVCIHALRRKGSQLVKQRVLSHPPSNLALCSLVVAELFYGAERSADPLTGRAQVEAFIAPLVSLPFDDASVRIYGRIRHDLESRGLSISDNDTMIAATALAHNLTLVTHNTKEFSRVPGLAPEDWEIP